MTLTCSAATNVGLHRENNEDAYLCLPERGLFAVADGLGGQAAGEVASAIAIEAIRNGLTRTPGDLDRTFHAANTYILNNAIKNPAHAKMGTTLTVAVVTSSPGNPVLLVGHAGDSACYLVRRGVVRKLTVDQTVAEGMRQAGKIPHPNYEHMLANCLGSEDNFSGADIDEEALWVGDTIILCTDGLTGYLDDGPNLALVNACKRPISEIADYLVRFALVQGGQDNVTTVAVRIS